LAVLGISATKGSTTKRETIEKATGWMLIVIAAFLIINGLPQGQEWYENTFVHQGWNNLIEITPIPAEFEMPEHQHEEGIQIPEEVILGILSILITIPIMCYLINKRRSTKVTS